MKETKIQDRSNAERDVRVLRRTKHKALYVLAKIIRVVTVPPVMVGTLIILLTTLRTDVFASFGQSLLTLLFLAIIPVMAYPISSMIPSIKAKGREGQRNLAFVLSLIGYAGGMIYAVAARVSEPLMIVFGTYFLSVIVLTIMNKVIRVRASGHACSIAGPIGLVCYFLPPVCIVISLCLYVAIFWASVHMGRHTVKEFVWGSLSSPLSLALTAALVVLL
ncbi:MAG: hypothetical protein E7661_02380 [Ruminococcaceae bacterium]|nr:hypothetical protein [Oscillospiraceae bacterium]